MNFDKPFWKTVFRESDGTASSSRLLTAAIVASSLVWVSFLSWKHTALPDLQNVGIFDCTTILALYGVGKISTAAAAIFGKTE